MLIAAGACRAVRCSELDSGNDVQNQRHEHGDSEDPDAPAMQHGVQELSVMVKCLRALVDEHIAGEVSCQEDHQISTGESDDDFFADGRLPEVAERAGG